MKRAFTLLTSVILAMSATSFGQKSLSVNLLGRYSSGYYSKDGGVMEISAYDKTTKRLFAINGNTAKVEIIDLTNPSTPTFIQNIDISAYGAGANSISVHNGVLAVAIEAAIKQDNGKVAFFNTANGQFINSVLVGALPDMLTFTPNGTKIVVANEGEPSNDYKNDPEGSITVIDISNGVANATSANINFNNYDTQKAQLQALGIRIFGPNATVSQDFEPEYISISADSKTAWVVLQENNAMAIVDLTTNSILDIKPLGYKDHNLAHNGIDASDYYPTKPSSSINIQPWLVRGLYLPDGIATYQYNGKTYVLTANEGDSRDYTAYSEEARIGSLNLDATKYPNASTLKNTANLGRLKITKSMGDNDLDGDYDYLYSFGARSFSIWDSAMVQTYDSGDSFERFLSTNYQANFNANHNTTNQMADRSDDKGPEPESVITATINSKAYAFIGLERQSGIMIYNITNPHAPIFDQYVTTRNLLQTPVSSTGMGTGTGGDLGPEGIIYISSIDSPIAKDLLVVSYEVSGTVAIYSVEEQSSTSMPNNYITNQQFVVYPNPANGKVIYFNKHISGGSIYSTTGILLINNIAGNSTDISSLPAGMYIIKTDKGELSKFIIK